MARLARAALAAALLAACAAEGLPIAGAGGGGAGGNGPIGSGGDAGSGSIGDAGAIADGGMSPPPDFALPTTGPTRAVSFRIDAAHTGGQPRDHLALPLSLSWKHVETKFVHSVLVADGRVFVFGGQGTLTALDTQSGGTLWGPTPFSDMQACAYDGGVLYVLGHSGSLTAADAATGTTKWTIELGSATTIFFDAPPLAADGKVFVNANYTLFAVSGTTGAILWTAPTGSGNDGTTAYADGVVYLANSCARTAAFDANTGKQLWVYEPTCSGGGGTAPAVYAHDVYVRAPTSNKLFDAAGGQILGTFDGMQAPSFVDGVGYFLKEGVSGGTLEAVDVAGATLRWSFTGDGSLSSAPIACAGAVFVGSSTGNLYGLDTSGNVAWTTYLGAYGLNLDQPEIESMVIAEGTLFVPSGFTLFAFR